MSMHPPNPQLPSLIVRPCEERDILSLLRIFCDAIHQIGRHHYAEVQISAWASSADDPESFRMRLAKGLTLVAERDGHVIAFAQLNPADVVDMLFCDPIHARGGVGGRLLAALEGHAEAAGQIVIDTKASLAARDFFAKHGYQSLGGEVVTRGGVAIPRVAMRKLLVEPTRQRWAILGNAGSGKSTLARKIAELTGAAVLDLDTVAWEGETSPPTRCLFSDSRRVIREFCSAHTKWIIEGCYEDLLAAALPLDPCLVWLHPGVDVCLARCRTRDYEDHKFANPAAQEAALPALLEWVAAYPIREGPMSEASHRNLYEGYEGRKFVTRSLHSASPA